MNQKLKIPSIVALLLIIISSSGCKKDDIIVDVRKVYLEKTGQGPDEWYTGMGLSLETNGTGTLIEGGDVESPGKYNVRGSKIIFKTRTYEKSLRFTIISEKEIISPSGVRLILYEK